VPEDVIKRRYERSIANFWQVYQPLADSWVLCDNSTNEFVVVARGERGQPPEVLNPELYHEIEQSALIERPGEVAD
jgi:predicted ABC-type ATPase